MRGYGAHGGGRWHRQRRTLIRPSLLLLLHEGPAHGYDLLARLEDFGIRGIDASIIYRILREMEDEGLIDSMWEEKGSQGPPRRVYSLTALGDESLRVYLDELKRTKEWINNLIQKYDQHMRFEDGEFHQKGKE